VRVSNFGFGSGAEKLLCKRKCWFLKKIWKKLKNSAPGAYIVAKNWDPDSESPKIVHSCSEIEGFGELGGILWHRPRPPNSTHTGGLRPRSGRRGGSGGGAKRTPPSAPQAQTSLKTERALLASYPQTETYPQHLWSATSIWNALLLQSNSRAPTSRILKHYKKEPKSLPHEMVARNGGTRWWPADLLLYKRFSRFLRILRKYFWKKSNKCWKTFV